MSDWKGWERDVLTAWKAPATHECIEFLTVWHQSVDAAGKNNPLGATEHVHGSSEHGKQKVQDYPSVKVALTAYTREIEKPAYANVLTILRGGSPIAAIGDNTIFEDGLVAWGVNRAKFNALILELTGGGPQVTPGAQPPSGASAAWRNLLRFYSRDVPKAHGQAGKLAESYRHIFH